VYQRTTIAVRLWRKRTGPVSWVIHRPESGSAIDELETGSIADRVAELIETRFAGSYDAIFRKQAKHIAHQEASRQEVFCE